MAIAYSEVQDAYTQQQAALASLQQAQAAMAASAVDPEKFFETNAAKAKVAQANTAFHAADQAYTRISAAYNKQNPTKPAQTPGQQKADQGKVDQQNEKEANFRDHGISETNAQRATREGRNAPKPARPDSPAQTSNAATAVTNSNISAGRASETGRHNQQTEQMAIINAQKDALYKAGLLYKDTSGQVSQEAQTGYRGQVDTMNTAVGAAKTLVETDTARRGQDIDLTKARSSFVGSVLNTALPQVVDLMLKTPKGSKIAGNFLRAYLTLANDAYEQAGLNKEPPPIDMSSPEVLALKRHAGYAATAPIPRMPTSSQISGDAAVRAAVGGFPVNGWNGPIGIEATKIPPFPPGTNGDGVDPIAEASQSPEGQAIIGAMQGTVKGILDKPKEQWTPQEQALVSQAQSQAKDQITALAAQKQAAPRPSEHVAASNDLRSQVRSALISGDPNQRLRIMAAAKSGLSNRAAGKPLTTEQTAVLANLDKEDLDIIDQQMTPELAQILTKPAAERTDADYAAVQAAVTNTSTAVKNRPTPPATPPNAPASTAAPTQQGDDFIDPNVAKAQQAEYDQKQAQRDQLAKDNPDLEAMMSQVEDERRAQGEENRKNGIMDGLDLSPIQDAAQQRLQQGEKAKPEYYTRKKQAQTPPGFSAVPEVSQPSDQPGVKVPGSVFRAPDGSFGLPGSLGRGYQPPEPPAEPEIPDMPKLFDAYATDLEDRKPAPEEEPPPRLLAPIFDRNTDGQDGQDDQSDSPYSLFGNYNTWRY